MTTKIEYIKQLREATGAGILECRQVLENNGYSLNPALAELNELMAQKVMKKSNVETLSGTVEVYSHNGGRIGVMVEVNCETDFASKSAVFRTFTHELALHIAAESPRWVSDTDVPDNELEQERERVTAQARGQGKPEVLLPRICDGAIRKFLDRHVLLRQAYLRDESISINQWLTRISFTTGENIHIRRFVRWELAEGKETFC